MVWLAVILAFLAQRCLPGVLVLPPLLCRLGMEGGPQKGAECGLLGGFLCLLSGCSPWILALYPLIGGISGAVFHNAGGFWGKWLRTVPVLLGAEALLILGHWAAGSGLTAALSVAWPELWLALACYPLAALIGRVAWAQRNRNRYG